MIDVLVCAIPVLDLQYPPSAPAIIKSCLVKNGYATKTVDWNLDLFEICKKDTDLFTRVQTEFYSTNFDPNETKFVDGLFENYKELIGQWFESCIQSIQHHQPKIVGLSVFSYYSHKSALGLMYKIKQELPWIKILLGGRGVSSAPFGPSKKYFNKFLKDSDNLDLSNNFGQMSLNNKLADAVVYNDGEQAVIESVKHGLEISSGDIEKINLNKIPFVNYDDYKINNYQWINEPILAITGSKGCVRQCSFCDIPVLWPKFKWRSGKHIASEMIYLKNKHGVRKFYMTDSLVNGSMKAFLDFIESVALWNKNSPEKLNWVGQYITRPKHQIPKEYYQLLKESGAEGLTIGIESGSDRVRKHMRKKFDTVDIYSELDQFQKHNISCVLLFFCSYPTEEWQDYVDTFIMLINLQKYCASDTVYKITLGIPYTHHAHTGLWEMQDKIGLKIDKRSEVLWRLDSNPNLTIWERVKRRLISQELCEVLHLPVSRNSDELQQIISTIKVEDKNLKDFFGPKLKNHFYKDEYNLTKYDHILMPLDLQKQLYSFMQTNGFKQNSQKLKNKTIVNTDNIGIDSKYYLQLRDLISEN